MSVSVRELKTYTSFARRFAGKFVRDRVEERRVPVRPAPHRPEPSGWSDERLTVAWLGPATVLINFYGTWLLTDPALPPLDAVLVSHAHMDHTDLGTLRRLPKVTRAVVQEGNGDLVRRFARVDELKWGEATEVRGARVEAIEVNHWGARRLTDKHRGYGGFLVEKRGRALGFGGDTAYTDAFARLRGRASPVTLAILPIGAYDPYVYVHANPEQSWRMAREMGAEYILPMHHSTFRLSREPSDEPPGRCTRWSR